MLKDSEKECLVKSIHSTSFLIEDLTNLAKCNNQAVAGVANRFLNEVLDLEKQLKNIEQIYVN